MPKGRRALDLFLEGKRDIFLEKERVKINRQALNLLDNQRKEK